MENLDAHSVNAIPIHLCILLKISFGDGGSYNVDLQLVDKGLDSLVLPAAGLKISALKTFHTIPQTKPGDTPDSVT